MALTLETEPSALREVARRIRMVVKEILPGAAEEVRPEVQDCWRSRLGDSCRTSCLIISARAVGVQSLHLYNTGSYNCNQGQTIRTSAAIVLSCGVACAGCDQEHSNALDVFQAIRDIANEAVHAHQKWGSACGKIIRATLRVEQLLPPFVLMTNEEILGEVGYKIKKRMMLSNQYVGQECT